MRAMIELDTDQRYRVFAHVGNGLSRDGVTVSVNLIERNHDSVTFEFWTRKDAVAFFQNLATAAEKTTASEADEQIPGRALMIEEVTASWEDIKR